jgi:hypothetical protein
MLFSVDLPVDRIQSGQILLFHYFFDGGNYMKRRMIFSLFFLLIMSTAVWAGPIMAPNTDATQLVGNIIGPGVTIYGTPTLTGVTNQQGSFTSGSATVGFDSGVVLSTGNINQIPGSNASQATETRGVGVVNDNISTDLNRPGDSQLNTLAGHTTFDANILTFQFTFDGDSPSNSLYFNFVFGSEEYIDYIGSSYNDVFGFFLDGVNIGLVNGSPITINTINNVQNSAYYINNINNTNGIPNANLDIKFDGLTKVLTASAAGLDDSIHTISLKIADTSDHILDAGVFIQKGTFSTTPTPVPEPALLLLLGLGLGAVGLTSLRKRT